MACTSGTRAKATSPTFFTFEQSDILSAIPTFGAWVATHTLGLSTAPTETATFCSVEPTGDLPLVTDWALLAFPPLAAFFGAYERLRNQVIAWKFSELCECSPTSGGACNTTSPAAHAFANDRVDPSASTEVGNEFTVNVTSASCYGVDLWLPATRSVDVTLWNQTTNTHQYGQTFAGATSGYNRLIFTTPQTVANGSLYNVSYCVPTSVHRYGDGATPPPSSSTITYTSHRYVQPCGGNPRTSVTSDWEAIQPLVCVGGPPAGTPTPVSPPISAPIPTDFPAPPAGPTCASYQDVCNELSVLLQEIESLQANVSIIRQTKAPDTAVYGTSHPGLTGHGTIAALGILGCSVTLTTVPSAWGYTLETPKRYVPKVGAIHFSDGTFNSDELQVHYDVQLVTDAPPFTTHIVYDFRPGIVATVTPLLVAAPV